MSEAPEEEIDLVAAIAAAGAGVAVGDVAAIAVDDWLMVTRRHVDGAHKKSRPGLAGLAGFFISGRKT